MEQTEKEARLKQINKSLKIRRSIVYVCIFVAFLSMATDLMVTRNFFTHIGELMLVSLFAFGYAIYNDYAIKRLKSEKGKLKNEQ